MRILLLAAGVAGLALSAPAVAFLDDQGRGKGGGGEQRGGGGGQGKGGGHAHQGGGHGGGGAQRAERRQERRAERRQERQVERRVERREVRRAEREVRRAERRELPRAIRVERRAEQRAERREQRAERGERRVDRAQRRAERRAVRLTDAGQVARLSWEPRRGRVEGCPPGLARKNNGCMPPGQVRQQQALRQTWYGNLWTYPDRTDYFYDDGYLYSLGDGGSINSYVPLLGGALWSGNPWPEQYEAYPVADYHLDYFGLDDPYDYQLADGAIFGVDPQSDMIQQVVALVAGDEWGIGQQMPDGYDIYNVPQEYRDQYTDSDDAWYRYSDGYVYQVDPTTQLIQAAIQLIT